MQIRPQSRLRLAWAFVIFWNLVSAPATFLGAVPAIKQGNAIAWVAMIFPFVGAAMLIWAVHLTLRWWKFGASRLELADVGPSLGDTLRARITATRLPGEGPVQLTLSCINRVVSGTGNNRSVWEKVLWKEEQTVGPESLEPSPEGAVVPISFQLPLDAEPTRADPRDDSVFWRLEARASLTGVDYDQRFEVPVAAAPPERIESARRGAAGPSPERPATSSIVVEATPEGGTQFIIKAGRNIGATFSAVLFAGIFCAGTGLFIVLTRRQSLGGLLGFVPLIIGTVLALFTLLIMVIALHTGLLSTRVTASRTGLTITSRILALSWSFSVPAAAIEQIKLTVGMQVGMTPYYDLKIARAGDRPVTISTMLRDRHEAEWLAAEIRRALR